MKERSLEEIERARWQSGALPPTSAHLEIGEFLQLRAKERIARALEAEQAGWLCLFCGGPVFYGSLLGAPIRVAGQDGQPDVHLHADCYNENPRPIVVRQKLEALWLQNQRT